MIKYDKDKQETQEPVFGFVFVEHVSQFGSAANRFNG